MAPMNVATLLAGLVALGGASAFAAVAPAGTRVQPQMGLKSFVSQRFPVPSRKQQVARNAVAVPVAEEVVTKDPNAPFDYGAEPPFSLADIRKAIPNHCFEKDTWRSMRYMFKDVAIVAGLAATAIKLNNPLVWPLYWLAQGTMFWALFVVGHDCGHGSFSNNKRLNDFIGHMTHASILVPFHGWRISHRTHHSNHGHIDNDESWVAMTRSQMKDLDLPAKIARFNPIGMLLAYPAYLWKRTPGKAGSHFDPESSLFVPNEKKDVQTSTAWYFAMLAILTGVGAKFGLAFLAKTYIVPYWINVAWLDVVTYLHHTEAEVPWYRGSAWNYMRGALSTRDRDYGMFNNIHHDIGTHVVHHLFPQMPHYHIGEATEAIKPVLGEYYKEPEKSGILPLHLVGEFLKSTRECIFVEDEGDVVYYNGDKSVFNNSK